MISPLTGFTVLEARLEQANLLKKVNPAGPPSPYLVT